MSEREEKHQQNPGRSKQVDRPGKEEEKRRHSPGPSEEDRPERKESADRSESR
ncbi:hypothetical protein [Rubrobacter taiwanensis]|jgi:hypothetical protein|uniref:hypothetical protein n=1 Tax=Rubrobacter taiwanensis TaxID=185139 RepID=UPI0014047D95|nr:hypothetical protein [Rubrobacter taiwanensis]